MHYSSLTLNYKRATNSVCGVLRLGVRQASIYLKCPLYVPLKHNICSANKLLYSSIFAVYFHLTAIYALIHILLYVLGAKKNKRVQQ